MVAFAVESMGRTVVGAGSVAPGGIGAKVQQQGPAPQPQLRRALMAVQAPAGIHQSAQSVHRAVHRVARAMASRMVIGHHVGLRLVPQFRQHLTHRGGPGLRATPLLKLVHQAAKLLRGGGTVDVPHPTVQFVGLAAAVANLQEPVEETEHHCDPRKPRQERIARRRPAIGVDRLGGVVGLDIACFGREHAVGLLEMDVIGRGRERDAQDAAAADGGRDVALPACPVGVMLVRYQMLGQLGRVADGGSHQTVSPQPLDDAIPVHVAVTETDFQQPRRNTMRRQEQGIRQVIDGSGHVAGGEAGAEPVGGAIGGDDLPQSQPGELARLTPESVEAIAPFEARREQLRGRVGPSREGRPQALGIVPDLVVLLPGHGDDDLFGPARRLRRGSLSFTMDLPGLRLSGHFRILFPGRKKDAKNAAGRIPGALVPAIR